MKLFPGILTNSIDEFNQQLAIARQHKEIKQVQIDVVDGYFADNLTLTPLDLIQADYGDLQLDFHLMTEEPLDFVNELVAVKNYLPIRAVIAQIERMSFQAEYFQLVKQHDWVPGISLDLYTPLDSIDESSWPELELVQLMTIKAGFQKQEFQKKALAKIEPLRDRAKQVLEITLDGGIKKAEAELAVEVGADGIVVGSGLWQAPDPVEAINQYLAVINQD